MRTAGAAFLILWLSYGFVVRHGSNFYPYVAFSWRSPERADKRNNGIGRVSMAKFAPQAILTPYHFAITRNRRGYWVATDDEGLIGGVFRSQKDALRFALFEAAGESARVRVLALDGAALQRTRAN